MKTLRLLLFEQCNRNCNGCCNKYFDLDNLPIGDRKLYYQYDQILLTGGEPMLYPALVINEAIMIKYHSPLSQIILYTAKVDSWGLTLAVLHYVNGLTVTLHNQNDAFPFLELAKYIDKTNLYKTHSFRLNVFKDIRYNYWNIPEYWKIKDNIEWIKNCPLPENEVFMKVR